jgi:hypothetical protein
MGSEEWFVPVAAKNSLFSDRISTFLFPPGFSDLGGFQTSEVLKTSEV